MTKFQKIFLSVLIIVVASIGYIYSKKNQSETIKIGRISPLSGDGAQWGEWMKDGIDLAVYETNSSGGVLGKKIEIVYEDDKTDSKVAVSALQKLINTDHISLVLGPETSGAVIAAAPIATDNKIVILSGGAASPKISGISPFVFRIYPTSVHEAYYLNEISQKLKIKQAAVLFIENDYGVGVKDELQKYMKPISVEGYSATLKDFRSALAKVKSENPDAVFMLGYPDDIALILKQAAEVNLHVQFIAPSTFDAPTILPIAGKAAEGTIFIYPELAPGDLFNHFNSAFKARYDKEPVMYNGYGYDIARIMLEAIKRAGTTDGVMVRNTLQNMKDFPGISGSITFNDKGDVSSRTMQMERIKDGKTVPFE